MKYKSRAYVESAIIGVVPLIIQNSCKYGKEDL